MEKNINKSNKIRRTVAVFSIFLILAMVFVPLFSISVSAASTYGDYTYYVQFQLNSYSKVMLKDRYENTIRVFTNAHNGQVFTISSDPSSADFLIPTYSSYNQDYFYYFVFEALDGRSMIYLYDPAGSLIKSQIHVAEIDFWDIPNGSTIKFSDNGYNQSDISYCNVKLWLDDPYHEGYDAGYDVGYDDGYDDGYDVGYQEGISESQEDVWNEAYDHGYNAGLSESVISAITDPVGALFSFELGLGVTIGHIVITVVGISLLLAFLKYFAGG